MAKSKKTKKEAKEKQKIVSALTKKAMGFRHDEVAEEYVCTPEGELKLAKRKVTKKFALPDIPAVKILLSQYEDKLDLSAMTEEELKEEKMRLLSELANVENEEEE